MSYSIAVLITVYNRKEKTLACLECLYSSILPKDHYIDVFLVNDGSTDGTSNAVKEKFPQVNLIQGTGNLFWNRGMHLAWQTASETKDYDFYLWLNDDTRLFHDAVKSIITDSSIHNHKYITVGSCVSTDKKKITYGGYDENSHNIITPNGKPQECYFFNGNFVLIPKYVFESTGNLDSYFRHSFGDFDYGLRAKIKGIKSFITSTIIGTCDLNNVPLWRDPNVNLLTRFKILYSALGVSPIEHFVYSKRHWGIFKAISTFISIHLRMLLPKLWKK